MNYQYGITTVAKRFKDLLPRTIASLAKGGFDKPRLFVDGPGAIPEQFQKYEITQRIPFVKTAANWVLSAYELYLRNPQADRYAIFQDDFVCYENLREYLDSCIMPEKGYWNLYTFPENERTSLGWNLSNQNGKGAVALVFSNMGIRTLLRAGSLVNRPHNASKPGYRYPQLQHKKIDGGIVDAMTMSGWREYCHSPSLIQHTGLQSSMGNGRHPLAGTFRGEDFDARKLTDEIGARKPGEKIRVHQVTPAKPRLRIGLIGYNCRSGLGELNRQLAEYADVDKWLIKPHGRYGTGEKPENCDAIYCNGSSKAKMIQFLDGVDVVLFAETEYFPGLTQLAKQRGKQVVCIPMQEQMPGGLQGWPKECDLFICPTKQSYEMFAHVVPSVYFPWPVDTERFQYKQRATCQRFLFINGHGGQHGRKGEFIVKQALDLWPEMPLAVRSQVKSGWPDGVTMLPEAKSNTDIYGDGDVLLAPHFFDGIGLEILEAAACGLPVISTDGNPWNEFPAIARIKAKHIKKPVRRLTDWYTPDAVHLVDLCKGLLGKDISSASNIARKWAELHSWSNSAVTINEIIRTHRNAEAV